MTPPSAAAARSRSAAAPARAPLRQPLAPRRVSGPARRPGGVARPLPRHSGPFARLLDAPFLDRLIRGRIWIALVGFALLGIVAMQVEILRLGSSIARSVTEIQHLTQVNEAAETAIAQAEPGHNVASEAASLGMVYPPAGNIVYLGYHAGDALTAAHSITLPTAPLFTAPAAGLTAPIEPTVSSPATDVASSTAGGTATSTSTGAGIDQPSNTTTDTPASTNSAGGTVSDAPAAPSAATAIGAGGGSSAPTVSSG
jgi:hypothetical protein